MNSRLHMGAWIVGAASLLACGDGRENETASAAPRLSDAEIASVTSAANTGEIAQANAALPKLTKPEAKQFAAMMAEMHDKAEQRQTALAREKGLTPRANSVSAKLAQKSNAIVEQLGAAKPNEIDRIYLEKQVAVHQEVLDTIDKVLIPSARDAELKQELQTSRGEVAMHLEHARDAMTKLD
jgi:putative membrane protein